MSGLVGLPVRRSLTHLVACLCWLAALVAQPAWAAPAVGVQQLAQRFGLMAAENQGEFGFAALDIGSGTIASYNGTAPFPMASTVKIAVAATYLSQVDTGRRSLDARIGSSTAYLLMERMITRSDNEATDMLIAKLGGPKIVDVWLRGQGVKGIRVDRTIAQLLSARRDLYDIRDSTTPIAMLDFLRKLDTGEVLKPESRYLLLSLMNRCITGSNRIRGLLPPGTKVEHKTGTLTGLTGDVGFITLPNGRRIAVALFARGGANRPAVIATAARAIYDAFAADATTTFAAIGDMGLPLDAANDNDDESETSTCVAVATGTNAATAHC
jgi:beta-lactamase class A